MDILATIGQLDAVIQYTDRPTVKAVIRKDDKLLILNKGLLPGGGAEPGESDYDAITRELHEELGVTVKDVEGIGTVVQYRSFLDKRYFVNGYTATLETTGGLLIPMTKARLSLLFSGLLSRRL